MSAFISTPVKSYTVYMVAFSGWKQPVIPTRKIVLPDHLLQKDMDTVKLLNSIYLFGQNDLQPQSTQRSVSMGDIILLDGVYWMVDAFGFFDACLYDQKKYNKMDIFGAVAPVEVVASIVSQNENLPF